MNGYWVAANVVLGLHMALLAGLTVGLVVAALGVLRRYPRLALGLWVAFLATALSQPLPSCVLTDVERWLRHRVEPEWDRIISVQRMMVREVAGVDVPERAFWWVGVVLVVAAGYAFWRYHRGQARVMVAWLRRGSR